MFGKGIVDKCPFNAYHHFDFRASIKHACPYAYLSLRLLLIIIIIVIVITLCNEDRDSFLSPFYKDITNYLH